jgi:hypothetical protein
MPITVSSNLTSTSGGSTITGATTTDSIIINAADVEADTIDGSHILNLQTVGTTREALVVGDVTTAKSYWVRLRNVDADNYVEVETYNSTNYVKAGILYPGEMWGPVRVPENITLHLTANTAACIVEVIAAEAGAAVV